MGFISVLFPFLLPLSIILVSKDTGEPLRESSGLARLAGTGEAGELVGRIDRGHPGRCIYLSAKRIYVPQRCF